jgi:hypothetical protein
VFPVKYKLGFYIPEDDILHSHRRENLRTCFDIRLPLHTEPLKTAANGTITGKLLFYQPKFSANISTEKNS